MPSLIDIALELARQQATGDTEFLKNLPYVFRLVCTEPRPPCGSDGSALFPLPLNPSQFEYQLPFSGEDAPQQQSGVISEEAGVVVGRMSIVGNTGWNLRPPKTNSIAWGGGRFTGDLADRANIGGVGGLLAKTAISGQLAWWLLANRCFEAYSEFKKDPALAAKTWLEVHIPKDGLHLQVRPTDVALRRSATPERVTYGYNIQLNVLGPAPEPAELALVTAKSWTDKAKEALADIRNAITSIGGLIDDLTSAISTVKRYVQAVEGILTDVRSVMTAAQNLVDGVVDFFTLPEQVLMDAADHCAAAARTIDAFGEVLPHELAQTFDELEQQTLSIAVNARLYRNPSYQSQAAEYEAESDPYRGSRNDPLYQQQLEDASAAGAASGGELSLDQAFGAGDRPGDAKRLGLPLPGKTLTTSYAGFAEQMVEQGDTLQSLAAKYLGDPAKAPELALINKLEPPYITGAANMPNTLRPGDTILIPTQRNVADVPTSPTGSQALGKSQADELLGQDFALVREGRYLWGWAIDWAHGGTDALKVRGLENFAQGLSTRVRTERGTCLIHPPFGFPRLVGVSQSGDFYSESLFRLRQQLLADPRTEQLLTLSFRVVLDAVYLDASVRPIGAAGPTVVPVTLR